MSSYRDQIQRDKFLISSARHGHFHRCSFFCDPPIDSGVLSIDGSDLVRIFLHLDWDLMSIDKIEVDEIPLGSGVDHDFELFISQADFGF